MEIQATYEGGKLLFKSPVRFKRNSVPVIVRVEDGEIQEISAPEAPLSEATRAMLDDFERILNEPVDESAIPELTPKQMDRWQAFELREKKE